MAPPNIAYLARKFAMEIHMETVRLQAKGKLNVSPPAFVAWDCTRRCNLKCEHCGASKEKYRDELSTREIKNAVSELAAASPAAFFCATGGEPLLRKDLLDVLAYAKSKGLSTGFATNGFFLDSQKVAGVRKAGVDSVMVSLDGLEKTHNMIRGNPESFRRAAKAIKSIIDAGVPQVTVATTVTKSNFHELEAIYDFVSGMGAKNWRISPIMPIGRAAKVEKFRLSPGQLRQIFEFVSEKRRGAVKILIGENLPYLMEYEEAVRDAPIVCQVGIGACCIGVSGSVRGCPEQPDCPPFVEGNIRQKPLMKVWQEGFARYRLRTIIEQDPKCGKCDFRHRCFGGCWILRLGHMHCIRDMLHQSKKTKTPTRGLVQK